MFIIINYFVVTNDRKVIVGVRAVTVLLFCSVVFHFIFLFQHPTLNWLLMTWCLGRGPIKGNLHPTETRSSF